jgi:2,4-diketo-3-deoxy-L-fuconate hydrolase
MRICRFNNDRIGVVRGGRVFDVTSALDALPSYRYPLPSFDPLIAHLPTLRQEFEKRAASAPSFPLSEIRLLAPVANPGKIIAAPVNYRKHLDEARADPAIHHQNQIAEIRRTALFLKARSALIGPNEAVRLRHMDRRNDHEIELVVVIGREANKVRADDARQYIAGYCIGLDMTVRGPEERSFRKSVDTFCVLGPWLVTADEVSDAGSLDMLLTVNEMVRQKANTRDLIIGVGDLIELASSFYTLYPGDILFTGTPEGVGPVEPGDRIRAVIEHIGEMNIPVIEA